MDRNKLKLFCVGVILASLSFAQGPSFGAAPGCSATSNCTANGFTSSGSNSGLVTLTGSGSGSAAIGVAAAAGTPSTILLPVTDPSGANYIPVSAAPSGGSMQLSWTNAPTISGLNITGVGTIVARITPRTAQAANIGATTAFTLPATNGYYELCAEIITTQAATSSSTQPQLQLIYTSAIDNVQKFNLFLFSNTFNETGNSTSGCVPFFGKASTVVQYQTQSYASSGATHLQYAVMVYVTSENANGQ